MRYLFILALLYIAQAVLGQDIIILQNGDEIQSKVLEINATEIKYRKYDNPDGPLYTLQKNEVFMIKYANGTRDVFSKNNTTAVRSQPLMDVYFLRETGTVSTLLGYEIFCDDRSICKLNNHKYTIYRVPEGKHTFSVQYFGRTAKSKSEKLVMNIEEGKTYYVEVTQNSKVYDPYTYCRVMPEDVAKELLPKLTRDTNCY